LLTTLGATFYVFNERHEQLILRQAENEARAFFRQIVLTRRWISDHGGIFVEKLARSQPSPYLANPEILDQQGRRYTRKTPAMVTKELAIYSKEEGSFWFHITSLKLTNPENAPDPFERRALLAFEREGLREFTAIENIDHQAFLRYISPLYVEEACLKCHQKQGYKLGDVRGGIDTSIPLAAFLARTQESSVGLALSHGALWLLGLSGMLLFYRREHYLEERNQRAEEEKQKLAAQLRQAQKMEAIGTLAGGIAHDFNNILSIIFGYNELAMLEKDPQNRLRHLEELRKGAERAKELVAQILAFSRKAEQQKQPLQVSLIIKEALKMLRASLPTTIEIRQNIASDGLVLADPSQIHQIIMNLCTNAYHAMRKTGGTLAVSLQEVTIGEEDYGYANLALGKYLKLEVSDTGSGIDPKIQEKIFEPYFTTKQQGEGTGLGLAVVHGIVKSHHGHITVYSEPGKGTSFHVYLPLTEREAAAAPDTPAPTELRGKGERVLFIDDEKQIREVVAAILTKNGYQVTAFADGAQALAEFAKDPAQFDLVITDMTMPVMTGADLAQKILALSPRTPIILCTGQSEIINREAALAMGICDYLNKPVLIKTLLGAARKALAKSGS